MGGKVRQRRRTVARVGVAAAVTVLVAGGAYGVTKIAHGTADPGPAGPVPTVQALGSLGRLAYGIDGDIYVADADGSNPVRIADGTPSTAGNCDDYFGFGPIWSPDGRYLAYRGRHGNSEAQCHSDSNTVYISDPEGHRVASFPAEGWNIAWSPDSTRVATWVRLPDHIGIYGLDGVRQALLTKPPGWGPPGDFDPVWSPDGASLLLPRTGVEIPVDGSTPRQLPVDDPRSQYDPTYSPNGAEIAYISWDGLAGLVVAAADGSQARVLIPGARTYGLVWSPTGDRIAFASQTSAEKNDRWGQWGGRHGPPAELAVLDVASGSVVTGPDMGRAGTSPTIKFSPEGDQILFTRTGPKGALSSLWSVHADGSDPHQLVAGTDWGDWQTVPTP